MKKVFKVIGLSIIALLVVLDILVYYMRTTRGGNIYDGLGRQFFEAPSFAGYERNDCYVLQTVKL